MTTSEIRRVPCASIPSARHRVRVACGFGSKKRQSTRRNWMLRSLSISSSARDTPGCILIEELIVNVRETLQHALGGEFAYDLNVTIASELFRQGGVRDDASDGI